MRRLLQSLSVGLGLAVGGGLFLILVLGADLRAGPFVRQAWQPQDRWVVDHVSSALHVAQTTAPWNLTHISGVLHVASQRAPAESRGTLSSVAASATSVTLSAANTARVGWAVYLHSSGNTNLFICFSASCTTSAFTAVVRNTGNQTDHEQHYVMPEPAYTGAISGIWTDALTGNARITEITR